jgi:aspartate/methionine/tyrosine aminotransferase
MMMIKTPEKGISRRVADTLPPIMQVMKNLARGDDVIDMSQGVPFFDPPMGAVADAVSDLKGLNRYGPDDGDRELKLEISKKLRSRNGVDADPANCIMVTSGANLGFFNAAAAICDVGDEVILLDPFYFNHRMTLDVLGIEAKHVPTDGNYLPDPERLQEEIGPRTRAVVLVSPNNPTGMTYPEKLVNEIIDVCARNGIFLISDETYEGFEYGPDHFSPASSASDPPVISLFSFSKNYALSGWRIGYMTFPGELFESLLKVQDTTVICPSRISQRAALYCLRDHPDFIDRHIQTLNRSRKMVISWLRENDAAVECPEPNGAYYALPRIIGDAFPKDSMALVKDILKKTGVLLVPGTPFGADRPPHFRIAYGNLSESDLRSALDRLSGYFDRI